MTSHSSMPTEPGTARDAPAERILVVRLSALGDVVHALPLLDALRRARPGAHIGWLVEERAATLLEGHPQIDRLWVAPRHELTGLLLRGRFLAAARRLREFVRELRGAGYGVAIDVQCNLRSALLTWASGARRRIGFERPFAKEGSRWLASERVVPDAERRLKVERNLELLRPLGIDGAGARACVAIADASRSRARSFFARLGPGPAIALHPGVSDFGALKRWPTERYAALAQALRREHGAHCVVTWGPGDRVRAERVVRESGGAAVLAPETAVILDLAALYERCDAVVGSDTGPIHLAAALGVPVVGLYGPKDPAVYAPWDARTGRAAPVVWKQVHCSPCTRRRCGNVICMPAIQVADVEAAVRRTLETNGGECAGASR